ncbi:MAG TPA: hypothetical protein VI299_05540 [Polyangiales bacterium]
MKRSWLIGAALVFSLSAVACGDDDDSDVDGGSHLDGGSDAGKDGGLDSSTPKPDAGDAGHDAG